MDKVYMLTVKTTTSGEDDSIDIKLYATKDAGDKAFDERVNASKDMLDITEDDRLDVDAPRLDDTVRWATIDNGNTIVDISLRAMKVLS